jgi:hypothetical protein
MVALLVRFKILFSILRACQKNPMTGVTLTDTLHAGVGHVNGQTSPHDQRP